jgi:hypothetical protein
MGGESHCPPSASDDSVTLRTLFAVIPTCSACGVSEQADRCWRLFMRGLSNENWGTRLPDITGRPGERSKSSPDQPQRQNHSVRLSDRVPNGAVPGYEGRFKQPECHEKPAQRRTSILGGAGRSPNEGLQAQNPSPGARGELTWNVI